MTHRIIEEMRSTTVEGKRSLGAMAMRATLGASGRTGGTPFLTQGLKFAKDRIREEMVGAWMTDL